MTNNPYEGLQEFVAQLPEFLQPLLIAALGAIPYVEGEGAAGIGIIVGLNPILAAVAGATGNILCVLAVVTLTSRLRESVVERRVATAEPASDPEPAAPTRGAKGRARLRRWLVRFGVPGASILAPLALPTPLTAAFFVGSGVPKRWVMLWQVVAIVLWTGLIAAAATGLVTLLGW